MNSIHFKKNKYLYSIILLLACALAPPQQSAAPKSQSTESSALKDNSVNNKTSFSNFDGFELTINIPAYDMAGNYRFLKIYDDQGRTLFLGQVASDQVFSLPIHKRKAAKDIVIELFSESKLDETIVVDARMKKIR